MKRASVFKLAREIRAIAGIGGVLVRRLTEGWAEACGETIEVIVLIDPRDEDAEDRALDAWEAFIDNPANPRIHFEVRSYTREALEGFARAGFEVA